MNKDEEIIQQTRSFDADKRNYFSIRDKEDADDYRYFPDPDLPPFEITPAYLEYIEKTIPALPEELIGRYMESYNLVRYDAEVITDDKETSDYFETLISFTPCL